MKINSDTELVSIIIPYYKKRNYIKKTINSILEQSYQKFEIIIIYDDESKVDYAYLKELVMKDERVKILVNDQRLGAGLSRNKGIDQSKGSFIAFIDADDIWKKDKLEIQINYMKKNQSIFSHTSYDIINKNDDIIGFRKARTFLKTNDIIKSCDIGLSTVIFKKKIKDLDLKFVDLKTKEDFVLWLKILDKNIRLDSIDKPLTSWRKLEGSLSSSTIQKLFDAFLVYNKFMNFNLIKSFYYVFCLSINYLIKSR